MHATNYLLGCSLRGKGLQCTPLVRSLEVRSFTNISFIFGGTEFKSFANVCEVNRCMAYLLVKELVDLTTKMDCIACNKLSSEVGVIETGAIRSP